MRVLQDRRPSMVVQDVAVERAAAERAVARGVAVVQKGFSRRQESAHGNVQAEKILTRRMQTAACDVRKRLQRGGTVGRRFRASMLLRVAGASTKFRLPNHGSHAPVQPSNAKLRLWGRQCRSTIRGRRTSSCSRRRCRRSSNSSSNSSSSSSSRLVSSRSCSRSSSSSSLLALSFFSSSARCFVWCALRFAVPAVR